MGNTHNAGNGKKATVGKDDVANGNGLIAKVQESNHSQPAKATLSSVAELTDLQKRLLQDSW